MEGLRRVRRQRNRYGRMLGLYYLKKSTKVILNRATFIILTVLSSIFLAYAFGDLVDEYRRFIFSQYASLCLILLSLRIWWIGTNISLS